jgi:hypothetical protein
VRNPVPAGSHVEALVETHLPPRRPAQRAGLALWVVALLVAESCGERTILTKMAPLGSAAHALRARLREFLCDGAERAAPCQTRLDVERCVALLLGWVLAWWGGPALPLASDATSLRKRLVVLRISVLDRGCAIPVAGVVRPHRGQGSWRPHLDRVLGLLAPAVPTPLTVLVLTDRGLWRPRWWRRIREHGWHPRMRIRPAATFAPAGARRQRARALVPGPGCGWVGDGIAFKHRPKRIVCTLVVVWGEDQQEPWLLLTDLPPDQVGVSWYGLRTWIALGFRALKRLGWPWQRTRRTAPERVARPWLVLAVATLLDLAVGTRLEEADWRGVPPGRLRRPHRPPPPRARDTSVFARGLAWLRVLVLGGVRWWRTLWLLPERWPDPPEGLTVIRHVVPRGGAHA